LDIFVVGTDRALYHKYWSPGTGWGPSVTGYERLGGVIAAPPQLSSAKLAPEHEAPMVAAAKPDIVDMPAASEAQMAAVPKPDSVDMPMVSEVQMATTGFKSDVVDMPPVSESQMATAATVGSNGKTEGSRRRR
jgi:hypothetical protein